MLGCGRGLLPAVGDTADLLLPWPLLLIPAWVPSMLCPAPKVRWRWMADGSACTWFLKDFI